MSWNKGTRRPVERTVLRGQTKEDLVVKVSREAGSSEIPIGEGLSSEGERIRLLESCLRTIAQHGGLNLPELASLQLAKLLQFFTMDVQGGYSHGGEALGRLVATLTFTLRGAGATKAQCEKFVQLVVTYKVREAFEHWDESSSRALWQGALEWQDNRIQKQVVAPQGSVSMALKLPGAIGAAQQALRDAGITSEGSTLDRVLGLAKDTATGAAEGAGIGSLAGPEGALVGGAVGAAIAAYNSDSGSEKKDVSGGTKTDSGREVGEGK